MLRPRVVAAVLATGLLVATACSSGKTNQTATATSTPAGSSTAHTAAPSPPPPPPDPANAKGLIGVAATSSSCTLYAINPETGVAAQIAKFADAQEAGYIFCPIDSSTGQRWLSPDLHRLAISFGGAGAGWLDSDGSFKEIVVPFSAPKFGDDGGLDHLTPYGFDKQGNFYYQGTTEIKGRPKYFRIPNGVTSVKDDQPSFAVSDNAANVPIGSLPGGLIGTDAKVSVQPVGDNTIGCFSNATSLVDGPYDPDRTAPYFYISLGSENSPGEANVLTRDTGYCEARGVPILQHATDAIVGMASNPDHSQVALKTDGNTIYIAGANGNANSLPAKTLKVSGISDAKFNLIGWR